MEIREATPEDWPQIWPFFIETVRAGETDAYDADLTSEQGSTLWMERPLGRTVVATNVAVRLWQSLGFEVVDTVPGAFGHPANGYVGLHVMFLPLG